MLRDRQSSGRRGRGDAVWRRRRRAILMDRSKLRNCPECGFEFMPRRNGGTLQRYCSQRCKTRVDNRHPNKLARVRAWWAAHPNYQAERQIVQKRCVLAHYGGECCSCCGETEIAFLTIDHIGGGGGKHRAEVGSNIYPWLIKSGFPLGYRVLCMNCNWVMREGRQCPHQAQRTIASA